VALFCCRQFNGSEVVSYRASTLLEVVLSLSW
jgi:hypothetical protein